MKRYEDERINTILANLELEMKHDEEYNYRDIEIDIRELCNNIDKVVDYINNGKQGQLYLNSNIWEVCYQALSDILRVYNLQFIGSDKTIEQEEIVKLKDYNNVKENPDIEMGTIFRFDNYVCVVDDYNQDNPNESIVFIYESEDKQKNGEYLEQISLLNENIKENIEEYMRSNYSIKSISRLSLLLELQDQVNQECLAYSKNYLMNEPQPGYEREWKICKEKSRIVHQMINEEKIRVINKKKDNMER